MISTPPQPYRRVGQDFLLPLFYAPSVDEQQESKAIPVGSQHKNVKKTIDRGKSGDLAGFICVNGLIERG